MNIIKKLLRNKLIVSGLLVIGLLVLVTISFYLGDKYAVQHLAIRTATPNQLATAMQQDDFWSTYRENTLIVGGVVSSVTYNNSTATVGLKTSVPYSLTCDVNNAPNTLKIGETIRILSEAYTAEREPSGVLLHNCVLL